MDLGGDPETLRRQIVTSYHTRIPVYRGEPDNIVGILHTRDVMREFVRRTWPLDDEEARDVQRLAAAWLTAQGLVEDAVRAHAAAGDVDAAAAVLGRCR